MINFLKRVCGSHWSAGRASSSTAHLDPRRAFMAKLTDDLQVLKRFSELKCPKWREPEEGEVEDHVLLLPGNTAEKWKKLASIAGPGQGVQQPERI